MTPDEIAARNRANASRSTGPRSAEGKATVAGNARRHGALARPDPTGVAAWLAVILDRPQVTPADLLPLDEAGLRALVLAEVEARLVAAQDALDAFEAGEAEPNETVQDLRDMADLIMDELLETSGTKREIRSNLSLLRHIARIEEQDTALGGHRHRLLRRYLREARATRRRAFEAWAASRAPNAEAEGHDRKKPNSRNKARFQPEVVPHQDVGPSPK